MHKCDMEGCNQTALTQGVCYDHSILCPKCNQEPCNPYVDNPECGKCIMDYNPEEQKEEEALD